MDRSYSFYVVSSGFVYKLEIYTGRVNDERLDHEPDLPPSSNVAVRLSRPLKNNQNYKVYFNNYYISLSLLDYYYFVR